LLYIVLSQSQLSSFVLRLYLKLQYVIGIPSLNFCILTADARVGGVRQMSEMWYSVLLECAQHVDT